MTGEGSFPLAATLIIPLSCRGWWGHWGYLRCLHSFPKWVWDAHMQTSCPEHLHEVIRPHKQRQEDNWARCFKSPYIGRDVGLDL